MPIQLVNDYSSISLSELVALRESGYSVLKSPHVGNQHPSNLVCAKLGFEMEMVSFTSGTRDKNFHPHLRIEKGVAEQLVPEDVWTPFAKTSDGNSLEDYHQTALRKRFEGVSINTDYEILDRHKEIAEVIMRVMTNTLPKLWYRKTTADGEVSSDPEAISHWNDVQYEIFQVSGSRSGWLVPNRIHMLFAFVRQSLESGRDAIYHVSGPQMVGYVGGVIKGLSKCYDAIRAEISSLPETLTVYVVPAAACRLITTMSSKDALQEVDELIAWYELLPSEERRYAVERFKEFVDRHQQFVRPIESAQCLSQYDISHADELVVSPWMLQAPLSRVQAMHTRLFKASSFG